MENTLSYLRGLLIRFSGEQHLWIAESFVIVFLTLIIAFIVGRAVNKIEAKAQLTHTVWDDAFVGALRRPLRWLIWLMGIATAADIAGEQSGSVILQSVNHFRYLGGILIATWFLLDLIRRIEKNLMDPEYCQKPMDQTTAIALGKLLRISVIITAVLIVLQYFEVQVSGILAFGGIGGIAVGFAAKDLLANFFGGLMIYLDRPFTVGDWIRSSDKEIEGTVEDIGWRLTRIRTFDKRPLYVPNSTFTQIAVENPSRMTNRRIYETIGVRYEDAAKMNDIVSDVRKMLSQHEAIDAENTLMVNFNTFAASSLDFFIYCFTKTTDWAEYHRIKQDVLIKILTIIESHSAECAFPTSTLHIPDPVSLGGAPRASADNADGV